MNYDNDPNTCEPSGLTPAQWLVVTIIIRITVALAIAFGAALAIVLWVSR